MSSSISLNIYILYLPDALADRWVDRPPDQLAAGDVPVVVKLTQIRCTVVPETNKLIIVFLEKYIFELLQVQEGNFFG